MMDMRAIIFHGTDCKPDDFWYRWLAEKLSNVGIEAIIPSYPEINHEPIDTFIEKIMIDHQFSDDTILVGHSSGAPLLLSILERTASKVKLAVLVAGYARTRPEYDHQADPVIQSNYDWKHIKSSCEGFIFVNSTNDPWGCNDIEGRFMFDKLGGTQIIRNDGHFGSTSYDQPYKEFPLLFAAISAALESNN